MNKKGLALLLLFSALPSMAQESVAAQPEAGFVASDAAVAPADSGVFPAGFSATLDSAAAPADSSVVSADSAAPATAVAAPADTVKADTVKKDTVVVAKVDSSASKQDSASTPAEQKTTAPRKRFFFGRHKKRQMCRDLHGSYPLRRCHDGHPYR